MIFDVNIRETFDLKHGKFLMGKRMIHQAQPLIYHLYLETLY